jgi:adenosylcobinamide-GDP ribazoletransferase
MIAKPIPQTAATSTLPPIHNWLLAAVQFLTRIPTPAFAWQPDTLTRAVLFFPLVGLALGAATGGLNLLLAAHLPRTLAALIAVASLIALTGALHEDGLADCADAFGNQHPLDRTLAILHDSRIGTYGTVALIVSIGARVLLIASLPLGQSLAWIIAATTLSRWAILPLTLLPPANPGSGIGTRIARQTPRFVLILGTLFAIAIATAVLHRAILTPMLVSLAITAASAAFYRRRLGGTTGDCFGATAQLVEIGVLLCGAWS